MNQQEVQQILDERGPWRVRLDLNSIQFENDAGYVITIDMWTLQGYPNCMMRFSLITQ